MDAASLSGIEVKPVTVAREVLHQCDVPVDSFRLTSILARMLLSRSCVPSVRVPESA